MHKPRRAYETGHRPKFLALVDPNAGPNADGTAEGDRALRFAARRARRVGADVVLLAVVEPADDAPALLGVADLIQEEARAKAEAQLQAARALVRSAGAREAEGLIEEGERSSALLKAIDADEDIALLILSAPPHGQGPGHLVNALLAGETAPFPIPIAIVPAGLSDAEIDALA